MDGEVIVAYQPANSNILVTDASWIEWLQRTTHSVVAKWTIKPKGGIPKLDTPILLDEDVKNIDNDI